MKKNLMIIAIAIVSTMCYGQTFEKIDKSILDAAYYPAKATKRAFAKTDAEKTALEPKIRVLYSRPLKKERVVFGELLKFNELWRVGANESTEILFMTDVTFGGKKIKAGRYTILIKPTATEWEVILSSDLDGWGQYSYDASKDVAKVTVPTQKSKEVIEALSISLYEKSTNVVHIKIGWDTTIAEIPVTLK